MQYPPQVNIDDSEIDSKGTDDKQEKTFMNLLSTFADLTSIQGIPHIKKANHWWSTAFWTLVFMCAVSIALLQTTEVFKNYFSYDYNTKIDVSSSVLQFPSVTVCNINPVRTSQLNNTSEEFNQFITSLRNSLPSTVVDPNKGSATADSADEPVGPSSGTSATNAGTNSVTSATHTGNSSSSSSTNSGTSSGRSTTNSSSLSGQQGQSSSSSSGSKRNKVRHFILYSIIFIIYCILLI